MITVAIVKNPFQPAKGLELFESNSLTVNEVVNRYQIPVNDTPLIAVVNSNIKKPLLREEWDTPIEDGSQLTFIPVVDGGIFTFIVVALLVVAAVAVALTLTVPVPNSPNTAEPDPVYSLKGQTNQIKLNDPIESFYGRVRHWPSYAAKPYSMYRSNEAYQYSLFCLGHGEMDVEEVRIEDTPIDNFSDIEYEIYGPNETVDLFRDNVQTSSEVGSVELFGPNEPEYDGWWPDSGGVVINDANTTTNLIEVDLTLPRGLYSQSSKGKLRNFSVSAEFEFIEIDNAGNEIGSWANLTSWSMTLRTVNPKRFTLSVAVPFGRYKLRGRRTNNASDSFKVGDTLVWESLRAFLPNIGVYGDVTVLAVKARASANLNDQSKRKINVIATRKLPIYNADTETWSAPTATRSIVWALCDVFRSIYGAYLTDEILDLESLVDLDAEFAAFDTPRTFDWVFDSATTVWEAARTVTRAGRAIPIFNGSQVTLVIDKPQATPLQLFNKENIIKDSFEESIKLFVREEYDSIEIEYTDEETWKTETVVCALPNSFGDRPERIILAGVTNRDRAYQEGMYMLSQKKYQRREIMFRTGVEGLLASYGDMIKVDLDMLGIEGTAGGFVRDVASDNRTVTLSESVLFESGYDYRLSVRGLDGTVYGPYAVEEGSNNKEVVLSDEDITDQLSFGGLAEPSLFIFGRSVSFAKDCVISSLAPAEDNNVEITAILYKPEVYLYDDAEAPTLNDPSIGIPDTALPTVVGVDVTVVSVDVYRVTWNEADGAQSYVVQVSADDLLQNDPNKVWETVGTTTATYYELSLLTDAVYVRVAGINVGQGPWAYAFKELLDPLIDNEGNALVDDDGNRLIG